MKNKNIIITIVITIIVGVAMFFVGSYFGPTNDKKTINSGSNEFNDKQETSSKYKSLVIKSENEIFIDGKGQEYKDNITYSLIQPFGSDYGIRIIQKSDKELELQLLKNEVIFQNNVPNNANVVVKSNEKISDYIFAGYGIGAGTEYLLVLKEDGTVDYINIQEAYKNNNFNLTKLNGLKNVVKFVQVTSSSKLENYENSNAMYGHTVLAQLANGNFYNTKAYLDIN